VAQAADEPARKAKSMMQWTELFEVYPYFSSVPRRTIVARYSKSASKDVKKAMERRKAGTLKSGRSGKTVKQEAGDRHRAVRGARKGQEGPSQKVGVIAIANPRDDLRLSRIFDARRVAPALRQSRFALSASF
jgi:hypothetical protein